MRILVIEDERELLQDISKGLALKGYAVTKLTMEELAARWQLMKNMI